ncbi:MAG: 2OG-Fe(II) oxygenase [Roseiarcus sp.]|uniref:2OG-Fe(II) oxygenase n=1 Tax=Roseiarcus sp. TaxID=1969460 RepID=UPI003C5F2E87
MKALTPTLSREARRETGVSRRPMRERGRYPSPAGGRRWPEGPDEGAVIEPRIDALDWPALETELDAFGCAVAPELISPETCRELAALYADNALFRSRIVMGAHGFGRGEYKYFADPLPDLIVGLRRGLYRRLAPVADRWNAAMGVDVRYPAEHEAFRARCHEAGQTRPTPLLLRYGQGDYNCLHQDVYGEHLFPLQVAILLSEPGRDFAGGEFVLTEQRPRMQSRAEVVNLSQGDGVIFAVRERPVQGARGAYRVNMRHGVSRLRSGERFTLGVIFHDAA